MKRSYFTRSSDETVKLGKRIGKVLRGGEILAYIGGLGAGKTTMTRGIALGMGLSDNVSSPTFALVNEYRGEKLSLIHFDMYRVGSVPDLESTGFYDYFSDGSVLVIEWSENISEALPENTVYIEIKTVSEDEREIIIDGDERFEF